MPALSGDIPHSVTQGDFDNPCQALAAQGGNSAGFDSGLQNSVQWTLNVTNDQVREYSPQRNEWDVA